TIAARQHPRRIERSGRHLGSSRSPAARWPGRSGPRRRYRARRRGIPARPRLPAAGAPPRSSAALRRTILIVLAGLILPTIHAELFLQLRLSFADPLRMLPCLLLRLLLEPVGLAH